MSWHVLVSHDVVAVVTLVVCVINLVLDVRKHARTHAQPKNPHGPIR